MTSIESLKAAFPDVPLATSEFRDNKRVIVPADRIRPALAHLKDIGFNFLFELTCVDYLDYPDATDRYGVVYGVLNMTSGERLILKAYVNDPDPSLPSVIDLWPAADWLEREVYDMFGIRFEGHPDLRRLLMPDEFTAWPLRKDYPLRGLGERHNFPVIVRAES
jgi:NADH-quinone oxidoreductase subunit C